MSGLRQPRCSLSASGGALDGRRPVDGIADIDPVCRDCRFYRRQKGDEVAQLADAFYNMIWSIRLYRRRLRESEKKYRSLFDSGPDPIFVINPQTFDIIDANPRAVEVYGYSREELIGKPFTELAPEHTHESSTFNPSRARGKPRGW